MKLSKLIVLAFIIVSCGSHPSKLMSQFIEMFPIGTTESRFTSSLHGEELVYSDTDISIYKVTVSTYHYVYHNRSDFRFFYFHNSKLKQVDRGQRATDLRIQIDNR